MVGRKRKLENETPKDEIEEDNHELKRSKDEPKEDKKAGKNAVPANSIDKASKIKTKIRISGVSRQNEKRSKTLYIKNLNDSVSNERAKETLYFVCASILGSVGIVESIVIRRAEGLRGQAFIRFNSISSAMKVWNKLHNFSVLGSKLDVHYAKSNTRARPVVK